MQSGHCHCTALSIASYRTVYHVVPSSSGEQWLVTQENGDLRQEHRTKAEPVDAAKARAKDEEPSQVKVHRADGNME